MTAVVAGGKRNNIDPAAAPPQVINQNPIVDITAGQRF
jgi:hypothetical protein